MQNDVLLDFYLASTKLHFYESLLSDSNMTVDMISDLTRDIEQARRSLGTVLLQLTNAAVPAWMRVPRLFRLKYTDEIDLRNLERCLVAAANKVYSFDPATAPRDVNLNPAKPSATYFLDSLGQVQSLVLTEIDMALSKADKLMSQPTKRSESGTDLPQAEQHTGSTPTDRSAVGISEKVDIPSTSPKGQKSSSSQTSDQEDSKNACSTTVLQLTLGSRTFRQRVRLPPSQLLCVSEELLQGLVKLDDAAAAFELEFIKNITRKLRTPRQAKDIQIATVLFSEALMWGLSVGLLTVQQLADRDPSVLLCLPRLTVLIGVRLLPDSPIGMNRLATGRPLPYIFNPFRTDLAYLARQLSALRLDQLCRLTRWLGPRGLPTLKPVAKQKLTDNSDMCLGSTVQPSDTPSAADAQPCHKSGPTWKTNLGGLHRLFKRISSVADEISVMFPTELRLILQTSIEINDTSAEDTALAEMEGHVSEDKEDDTSSDHMTDVEEEVEVPVCGAVSEKQNATLATLFDWCKVTGQQNSKLCLSEALRDWYAEHPKIAEAMPAELKPSGSWGSVSPLEFGFDVLSWITGIDQLDDTSCSQTSKNSPKSERRTRGVFSPSTFSLGTFVEGELSQADRPLLNHLPPWQPDRVPRSSSQTEGDGASDDEWSRERRDEEEDSDDEEQTQRRSGRAFVVGKYCAHCLGTFGLFRRRHHCRRCGHIFCSTCCNYWDVVEGLGNTRPVRVCIDCHEFLQPMS